MRRLCAVILFTLMAFEWGCSNNLQPAAVVGPAPGIALTLARERAGSISGLVYDLSFSIPAAVAAPISGKATIRFTESEPAGPLVLDFSPGSDSVASVAVNGKSAHPRFTTDHIVISQDDIQAGGNTIEIVFRSSDAALNRNPDFMYTLFVPARAHLAFPCFDQPDLKARFSLQLEIPADWQAVSNGAEMFREAVGNRVRVRYAETQPISTYLFAFAAGKFQVETAERNGRSYRMFHRETDAAKVARNRDAIFSLHASALEWLEKYTAIPYPFGKFDFVLIPSFQFGGMEHPGSIFYNASGILLDESATENQILNRASTIAHETSHMWFGDLVTMQWFNDVWMKEVFANFMAAKIVNPAFPNVNHDLRFLVANYPAAYAVDRTAGTHPIRQELDNLDEAGSLYGAIIYQKAPIVMRQLERILGPQRFQEGLRAYLQKFQFGNSTWIDLVRELDARTDLDLAEWSHAWVEEPGRPSVRTERDGQRIAFVQSDPTTDRALQWTQQMDVVLATTTTVASIPLAVHGARAELHIPPALSNPTLVLPTGGGLAYGDFTLDSASRAFLLRQLPDIKDPLTRGAAWVTLWEEMLDRRIRPDDFVNLALAALPLETTEQNVQLVLSYLGDAYWTFLSDSERRVLAPRLEAVLRAGIGNSSSSSLKSTYFSTFRSTVTTPDGLAFLERVWRRQEKIAGLKLAEPDEATMALELAVRSVPAAAAILDEQRSRFKNPDRKARFEFVMPALADAEQTRAAWFEKLKDVQNRRREPWVLEGLQYLHHPLRAAESEKFIRPALDLLVEIQRTGDIFFPKRWMDNTLGGHKTGTAAETVAAFLAGQKDYPPRLRRIVLQSADELFRAAQILSPAGR